MDKKPFGLLDNFSLKMIAIITMLIDHVGFVLLDNMTILRTIGRIAFPIFCFLIVEGFFHTRSHMNYLIRLSVFALLSEIPFDLAFYKMPFYWEKQNVFITLALGLFAIFCLEEMNNRRVYCIPFALTMAIAFLTNCDYGVGGVVLICVFYLSRQTPWMRFVLTALILYAFYGNLEMYGLIAMLFIALYNGKRGPEFKMIFYWFYPVHLLVLYAIAAYL